MDRVRFIQDLHAAGLGSKAVLRILPGTDHGVLTDGEQDQLLTERERVQAQLVELTVTRDTLDDVVRAGQAYRADPSAPARRAARPPARAGWWRCRRTATPGTC
ncbi:hypothetical protein AB2L27_00785 [Kineococcus sp. LSe6-4]|uniref:Uncharacterized protein n=1 Tax=Kineococcus halophytocola TaxID=3234027 RepID=A0ABV4GVH2_9ACTN